MLRDDPTCLPYPFTIHRRPAPAITAVDIRSALRWAMAVVVLLLSVAAGIAALVATIDVLGQAWAGAEHAAHQVLAGVNDMLLGWTRPPM